MASSSSKSGQFSSPKRIAGYLNKIESRTIGGPIKRKFWFAISDESPNFYWYKNKDDVAPTGKLNLSGAAFTFDPREQGRFEIHYDNEAHVFETADNKARLKWLKQLQSSRRRHYEKDNAQNLSVLQPDSVATASHAGDVTSLGESAEVVAAPLSEETLAEELTAATGEGATTGSATFYLTEKGELNERSLQMPPAQSSTAGEAGRSDIIRSAENFLEKIADQTHALATEPSRAANKVRLRLPSLSFKRNSCDQCKELIGIVNSVKDRCHELTDEVSANQDLVGALRQGIASSKNQIESLKQLSGLPSSTEQVEFILERESRLTALQLNFAEQRRENQLLREQIRSLEARNAEMTAVMEAYRDSVRTKEELIMKLVDQSEISGAEQQKGEEAAPDAVLVDVGIEVSDNVRKSLDEASVDDVTEMKDLVQGYQTQNQFLNQEVLELQQMVQALERRERQLIRQNFDIEASYYQLKSKYVMVLNHFKSSSKQSTVLEPGVLQELIDDATRSQRPPAGHGRNSPDGHLTDSLGFYLTPDMDKRNDLDLLGSAAQYKKKSDEILLQQSQEQNEEYLNWLTAWDSFLVNFTEKPLSPSIELKNLVRTGVPKTYRRRVWKSLVSFLVHDTVSDLGKGYYETLLRRSSFKSDSEFDPATKQIDLDLARTLPTNKYFDDPEAGKIESLRRVLYAYRWHNSSVGYCQGLNRLAAIALLYLEESDAFWFLVSCVEYLQPPNYYSPSLICAVADQKVLKDLVSEKLPKFASHLKQFDVDLSLFTLSWFLTCFVDSLPHNVYLQIFDVFLYEGNKVLFRFALAVLKLCEAKILACRTVGALHYCLSRVGENITDYKRLAHVAFHELNPFPLKAIETRRQHYLNQMKTDS
uniref:TBC1 domain family member 2B n=1 Tax=Plectus sambesii TaxID=2011161 RepID=A0A914UYM0_9BILA